MDNNKFKLDNKTKLKNISLINSKLNTNSVKFEEAIKIFTNEKFNCVKTGKPALIKYYNFYYSKKVYLTLVKNRVKKQLLGKLKRDFKMAVMGDLAYYYVTNLYPNFEFKKLEEESIADFFKISSLLQLFDLIILPWSMDDQLNLIWNNLRLKNIKKKEFLPIFLNIQDRELLIVSKLLNINYFPKEKDYLFDDLDNQYYGIKTTFLKNGINLEEFGL